MELKFMPKSKIVSPSKVDSHAPDDALAKLVPNTFTNHSVGYVFVVNKAAPREAINYLLEILKNKSLNVSLVRSDESLSPHEDDIVLLVTCDKKILSQNAPKAFISSLQIDRQVSKNIDNTTLILPAAQAKQERILLHILESIVQKERSTLIGLPNVVIYPGQSIVQIYHREQVILDYYPLHHNDTLNLLKSKWGDLELLRRYFGETIGYYFAFLVGTATFKLLHFIFSLLRQNFYTALFLYTSPLCLLAYFYGHLCMVNEFVTFAMCISLFVFLKMWKRQSNRLAGKWGTIEALELESARPSFRSKGIESDPITGELVPFYPIRKTWAKEYLISLPCVLLCLFISFEVMCIYFDAEKWAFDYYQSDPSLLSNFLSYIPSIIYSLIVMFMNRSYRVFATKLNDYENHRTQSSHENHWIVKLVLFEFVNNFMSLFYIAFYLHDVSMLQWNLITMLTINQLVDNLLETILPLCSVYYTARSSSNHQKKNDLNDYVSQILYEKELYDYEGTYYDYLELFVQFGYAFLFVSILPLAPIIAGINCLIETRLDALKLCIAMRKPRPRPAKSVNNAWVKSFEVLCIIVVISNLMIISFVSTPLQEISTNLNLSNFEFIIYIEHIIFAIILLVYFIVPDIPKEVNLALNRQKYLYMKNAGSSGDSPTL